MDTGNRTMEGPCNLILSQQQVTPARSCMFRVTEAHHRPLPSLDPHHLQIGSIRKTENGPPAVLQPGYAVSTANHTFIIATRMKRTTERILCLCIGVSVLAWWLLRSQLEFVAQTRGLGDTGRLKRGSGVAAARRQPAGTKPPHVGRLPP